jgi:hypothetical protein
LILAGRWRALIDDAVLHGDFDLSERDDVEERIAVDDDDVGDLPGLDGAELTALADDLSVDAGRRRNGSHRRHAHATCTLISRHNASLWKFIGVPESVPIPITAPESMNCLSPRSRKNISRSVRWK